MYEWYKLDEAAAILKGATGKQVGVTDLLKMAFAGELRMSTVIPGWEAPGVGDLVLYALPHDPKCDEGSGAQVGVRIASATDGFFCQLGRYDFQTLRNHGHLSLAGKVVRLPGLDGTEADWAIGPDAPTITLDDLRVSAAEIERLGSELAGTKTQPEPVVHQGEDEKLTLVQPVAAPIGRQRLQEAEILRVLRELEYDPKRLPRPPAGTPGPKAEARAALPKMTDSQFKKAWDRLRRDFGDIQDAD